MDNEEPDKTQEIPAAAPVKPSLRQRAQDRWSTLSDRGRLISIIVAGVVIFVLGFGIGLAVDGGHGRGHGYYRGGDWCGNEWSYRHHHHRWDCPPTTAPSTATSAPTTTAPTTTTTAPTTTPAP